MNIPKRDCPTCGVKPGEIHASSDCDEQCPYCGLLVGNCNHELIPAEDRIPFNGTFPGYDDCVRLGLFAKMVRGRGWVPCAADDPESFPDLNSLYHVCKWNREEKRWEKRDE